MKRKMTRIAFLVLCLVAASAAHADDDFFMTLGVSKSARLAGLLDYILPIFKLASNVRVQVLALEPGQEVASGEVSDANALLLDDRAAIDKIMADKFGILRHDAIYDDALIAGPKSDPAGIRGLRDAGKALAQIAAKGASFVGRGDGSEINLRELRLWKSAGSQPDQSAAWYRETKQDMPATLSVAAATNAYTLTDRATWASFTDRGNLEILGEGDPALFNVFVSVMVNPEKEPRDKYIFTRIWYDWLTDKHGLAAITSYKIDDSQIFFPCQGDAIELCQGASQR
jgi:tungstate transport system substrate-binding protein